MSVHDDIIADLTEIATTAQELAKRFSSEPYRTCITLLQAGIRQLELASSGSWIGYHACIYLNNFAPRTANDFFDQLEGPGAGFSRMRGEWKQYEREDIKRNLFDSAAPPECRQRLEDLAREARDSFLDGKSTIIALLDALLSQYKDRPLQELRDELDGLAPCLSASDFIRSQHPRRIMTTDHTALAQGLQIPPHREVDAWLMQTQSHATQLEQLSRLAGRGAKYVERKAQLSAAGVMQQLKATFGADRTSQQGERTIRAGKGANIFTGDMPNAVIQQANGASSGGDINFAARHASIERRKLDDSALIDQAQFNKDVTEILHSLTDAKEVLEGDQAILIQFFASLLGVSVQGKTIGQLKAEFETSLKGSTAVPALQRLASHATPVTQGIVSSILYSAIIEPLIAGLSALA